MKNDLVIPKQQYLDHLTRIDELILQNTQVMRQLVGGGPVLRGTELQELRKRLELGEWVPYAVKTIDLSAAKEDERIEVEGDFIHAWTDGSMQGVGVRVGRKENDLIYLERRNPIHGFRFWQLYLTSPLQAGKTLDLMIGRETEAETTEVTTTTVQKFYSIRTDKDTHFTGAIAVNAKEDENLAGLLSNKIRITGISLQGKENLNFRVIFWKTDGFEDADLDLDRNCAEAVLDLPTSGYQIAGANQYYLDMRGLDIDYEDEDASRELHVSLQCLTAAGKTAGAGGEVVLDISYELRT